MDRVFKRIGEGLDIFNTLYDRHESCSNSSQKDKLEADLKKEIKKLQRFREQVKGWQAMNEVKEKRRLIENRKLIEIAMEKYKSVERGSKQKSYSDEVLMGFSESLQPEEAAKLAAIEFLQKSLEEIERQVEGLEAEIDKVSCSKKNRKAHSGIDEHQERLEVTLERHHWHQEKLEIALRLLENGILKAERLMQIKDDLEYYLESNQEYDFMEDDTIYDDLHLNVDQSLAHEVTTSFCKAEDHAFSPLFSTNSTSSVIKKLKEDPKKSFFDSQAPSSNSSSPLSTQSLMDSGPQNSKLLTTSLRPASVPVKPSTDVRWATAISKTDELFQTKPISSSSEQFTSLNSLNSSHNQQFIPQDQNQISITDNTIASMPPGIQNLILSFLDSRNSSEQLVKRNAIYAGQSWRFSSSYFPSPETATPSSLESQRVAMIWNSIRGSADLHSLVQRVDTATLFYAFYFASTPYERAISKNVLVNLRHWKLHHNQKLWFQRFGQPKSVGEGFEVADFKVFDAASWSLKEMLNYKFEYSFLFSDNAR
ncbi:BA75_04420T0 [Komagataella pastoris]|uniref:BA75_04420T0 n=1 Tax=Komagataella pastoris TaxID=4922 RepID=A0A1B2JHS5_PICPA|nr:BA75_04420T0 [Komagataella pastoris]